MLRGGEFLGKLGSKQTGCSEAIGFSRLPPALRHPHLGTINGRNADHLLLGCQAGISESAEASRGKSPWKSPWFQAKFLGNITCKSWSWMELAQNSHRKRRRTRFKECDWVIPCCPAQDSAALIRGNALALRAASF